MKRVWSLRDLRASYPGVDSRSASMLCCVRASTGQGRYIKWRSGGQEFAEVLVHAEPAHEFLLECRHEWPKDLPAGELSALERALVGGIFEGTLRGDAPAWACRLTCADVSHRVGQTTSLAVRLAAALAVEDMLRSPSDWAVRG